MTNPIIKLEDIGKLYTLGYVGTGTLRDDIRGAWARIRGKENPNLPVGLQNGSTGTQYLWALRNVNLEIYPGEILGIIGANGSGKSTLLKLLSRVTSPTTGKIKMNGQVGSLLEVGTGFHPELTGRENVFLNGSILGMSRLEIEHKFDEIVEFAGVERYIDTPVKRYSSGMYVRLGFAVAAHLDPDILIVDEVLAVGDAAFQKKAIEKIESVSSEGRTILFVSHNMGSIREMTTRCIQLQAGKIVNQGKPELVVERYLQELQGVKSGGDVSQYRFSKGASTSPAKVVEINAHSSSIVDALPVISLGETVRITLKIIALEAINKPFVAINIKNSQLTNIARIHTHKEDDLVFQQGENLLECTIPDIQFYPGNFLVSIGIRSHISSSQHWDIIQDYPCFRVANVGEHSFPEIAKATAVVSLGSTWRLITSGDA